MEQTDNNNKSNIPAKMLQIAFMYKTNRTSYSRGQWLGYLF